MTFCLSGKLWWKFFDMLIKYWRQFWNHLANLILICIKIKIWFFFFFKLLPSAIEHLNWEKDFVVLRLASLWSSFGVFRCRFNETFHFLFWTMFGVANQDYVDMPQFVLAEFVGRILYGIFTLLIVIVLLNMLIAMITNSFQKIEVRGPRMGTRVKKLWLDGFRSKTSNTLTLACDFRTMRMWSGSLPGPSCISVTSERDSPSLSRSTSSLHPKLSFTH